jgi:hypothetical protein
MHNSFSLETRVTRGKRNHLEHLSQLSSLRVASVAEWRRLRLREAAQYSFCARECRPEHISRHAHVPNCKFLRSFATLPMLLTSPVRMMSIMLTAFTLAHGMHVTVCHTPTHLKVFLVETRRKIARYRRCSSCNHGRPLASCRHVCIRIV